MDYWLELHLPLYRRVVSGPVSLHCRCQSLAQGHRDHHSYLSLSLSRGHRALYRSTAFKDFGSVSGPEPFHGQQQSQQRFFTFKETTTPGHQRTG